MPFNANDNSENNKDKTQEQQPNQAVSLAGSGGQGNASATGRVANFSTGQQSGQTGSGRFTNLQKYIGANQGSGERLGGKIGQNFNDKTGQQTKDINNQNSQIAQNINAGKDSLQQGQGFQTQLGDIGKGFESFKSMEDRGGFDAANQQATNFAKSPDFNKFQTIQAGNAIDNDAANAAQANALQAGTNLNSYTQDQLNKVNTEQGRYDLLKNTFGNKKNYSSGNARFDQLFLQNSPTNVVGNLQNQFNQGNNAANQLVGNINTQGQDLSKLLTDEGNLVTGLNTQAKTNQDLFNTKLGDQKNIDDVNQVRNAKYNEYLNQLKTGQIGQEVATDLGLAGVNTYQPGQAGQVNSMATATGPKMGINGVAIPGQQPAAFAPRDLRTYNTDLANTAQSYLQQGRNAANMQDITTDQDYDAYKALQSISGLDSGKLTGASTLDKAVQAGKNSQGETLADRISKQDEAFRNQYAGRDYSTYAQGRTGANDRGNFLDNMGSSLINTVANMPQNLVNIGTGLVTGSSEQALDGLGRTIVDNANLATAGAGGAAVNDYNMNQYGKKSLSGNLVENDRGSQLEDFKNKNWQTYGGAGTSTSFANIDDYINKGLGSLTTQTVQGGRNLGVDKGGSQQAQIDASNLSRSGLQQGLDNIVNRTGVKNQAQLVDDKNNEILNRAKRFGRLV
jgi:hypothetical protein